MFSTTHSHFSLCCSFPNLMRQLNPGRVLPSSKQPHTRLKLLSIVVALFYFKLPENTFWYRNLVVPRDFHFSQPNSSKNILFLVKILNSSKKRILGAGANTSFLVLPESLAEVMRCSVFYSFNQKQL